MYTYPVTHGSRTCIIRFSCLLQSEEHLPSFMHTLAIFSIMCGRDQLISAVYAWKYYMLNVIKLVVVHDYATNMSLEKMLTILHQDRCSNCVGLAMFTCMCLDYTVIQDSWTCPLHFLVKFRPNFLYTFLQSSDSGTYHKPCTRKGVNIWCAPYQVDCMTDEQPWIQCQELCIRRAQDLWYIQHPDPCHVLVQVWL